MLEVHAYNAGKGDCVRLRYGGEDVHNVFVDTGTMRFAQRLEELCLVSENESLDMLVLTHADDDHIGGILSLLRTGWVCPFAEVRMNASDASTLGNVNLSTGQNNEVYARLRKQEVKVLPMTSGDEVCVAGAVIRTIGPASVADGSDRTGVPLAYGRDYSRSLAELGTARIAKSDRSVSNRNSIVFTFAYEGCRILMTGDAWAGDIVSGIGEGVHDFDLVKLPHHGSIANVCEEFGERIRCHDFLICTDGVAHPDKQTVAKLIRWYGDVNVYSPSAWWARGFFTADDDRQSVKMVQVEGLVTRW